MSAASFVALLLSAACAGTDDTPEDRAGAGSGGAAGTAGAAAGASGASAGSAAPIAGDGALAGQSAAGTGGTAGALAGRGGVGGAGGAAAAAGTVAVEPPASCAEAARAYSLSASMLDASFTPDAGDSFWGGAAPRTPVAVDPDTNRLYVGFTQSAGSQRSVVLAAEDAAPADAITIADATIGGIAVTSDGLAALLFDPNPEVNSRIWAAVARFGSDGSKRFSTDLFRSPNLDDEGTKGAPSSARFAYVPDGDRLLAYFGHTQRYDDGVRHQGGYLAFVESSGTQARVSGWYGSHNLDQRLLVDGSRVAVTGLGDAFPKGIFFAYTDQERLRTNVVYKLAADGVGSTNGQLGGMIDLGEQILVPFVTNRSVSQDLDAGPWPDTDEAISMQIRDAAAAGTDLGLLYVPKTTQADVALEPTWLDAAVANGARMNSLKSAAYGTSDFILLAWAETTGGFRDQASRYFTMVIDRDGAVCQPKTELEGSYAFSAGDDLITRPDGRISWAGIAGNQVQVVTLTP